MRLWLGVLGRVDTAGCFCLVAPKVVECVVHLLHPAGKFGGQRRLAAGDEVLEGGVVLLGRAEGTPAALQCGQPVGGLVIGDDRVVHLQIPQVGQGGGRRAGGQADPDLVVGRGEDRPGGTGADGEELQEVPPHVQAADAPVEVAELVADADLEVTFGAEPVEPVVAAVGPDTLGEELLFGGVAGQDESGRGSAGERGADAGYVRVGIRGDR